MEKSLQMLKRAFRLLFCSIASFLILAGCAVPIQPQATRHSLPDQSPTAPPLPAKMKCLEDELDFSDQIRDILEDPQQFNGKAITLTGYYRGWDLLKEAQGPSPVTRSDWVLRDRCGAIYVLARDGMGLGLNPGDKGDTVRVVEVNGIVRISAKGQPYIEPREVKLVR